MAPATSAGRCATVTVSSHHRHTDHRDGHLFVTRGEVSGDSDMAFIKMPSLPSSMNCDGVHCARGIASPFLIHHAPDRRRREWIDGKPHWAYVMPDYLSKACADARDAVERLRENGAAELPALHVRFEVSVLASIDPSPHPRITMTAGSTSRHTSHFGHQTASDDGTGSTAWRY
jgi:enterobacteria phage integrase